MSAVDVDLRPLWKDTTTRSAGYGYLRSQLDHWTMEFVVVYVTVGGYVIPMCVMQSDPIGTVKLRIQACKGFVVRRQTLVFEGRELSRTRSLVREYNITSGKILHLVLRLSDLLLINVKATSGEEFEFHVHRHRNVEYLKRRITKKGKGIVDLKDPDVFLNGEKLQDPWIIGDFCNNSDVVVHLVVQGSDNTWGKKAVGRQVELALLSSKPPSKDFFVEPIVSNSYVKLPPLLLDMINSVSEGLVRGKKPVMSSEGSGGSYFMQDGLSEKYIAVFKPIDEEPLAANSPQGLPFSANGEGLKRGTRVGEGALREVAAYILDHPKKGPRLSSSSECGFAGVCPTVMVQCLHQGFNHPEGFDSSEDNVKIGSLQMFMKNHGSCEDMGPKDFPVDEVHKISVLDIRTANADRHAGNILLHKDKETGRIVLTPIDHGYCLPENFEDCTFDWLYWPQARQPFSKETVNYIKSLNVEQDIELLKSHGVILSSECVRTFRISTMLLKKGADRGLTPFALGSIMSRETLNKKSAIEEIVRDAEDSMLPGSSEAAFLEAVSAVIDTTLNKLV